MIVPLAISEHNRIWSSQGFQRFRKYGYAFFSIKSRLNLASIMTYLVMSSEHEEERGTSAKGSPSRLSRIEEKRV
jgi:hypothetical protein